MKRTFSDKLFDNFGWLLLAALVVVVVGSGAVAYEIASNIHDIAREFGGIARAAADGYSHAK